MLHFDDTIAAFATPPGEGGIGIVRISGRSAFQIADRVFHSPGGLASTLQTHTIHYGVVRDPESAERLDDVLLLIFRAPHSYTGEDIIELSCHGGQVTLGRVLTLALREGARSAEPGEFTQRAFLNGRMDLAQAEAVCDQIRAKTEAAQRLAIRQREGVLSRKIERLRNELVGALAAVEVTIDFSDEVGDLDYPALAPRLGDIRSEIERLLASAERGRVFREGVRLVIVGRPNVGKSSLMNLLLGEQRAIVTPVPGTTRDVIEESANIRGIPITAVDTAGLRETADVVEKIGVARAESALETASLVLFVMDGCAGWTEGDEAIASKIARRSSIWILNKSDVMTAEDIGKQVHDLRERSEGSAVVSMSALTGSSVDELERAVLDAVLGGEIETESVVVTNARHIQALESARSSVIEAERTTETRLAPDFISIDLNAAAHALGAITGVSLTEEVIHRIFRDFCVGK